MLGANGISKMETWVNASYAVHQDLKSHMGGAMSFRQGATMSKSSKQKLNVKSYKSRLEVDRKLEVHVNGGYSHDTTHAGPSR
jgi:hypothetical protein